MLKKFHFMHPRSPPIPLQLASLIKKKKIPTIHSIKFWIDFLTDLLQIDYLANESLLVKEAEHTITVKEATGKRDFTN